METELKLLLAPEDLSRLRRDPQVKALQQGRASTRRVHSVYYDTPERSLLRAGLALRLRSDGGRWLQTLKTEGQAAAGLHVREEWEWPLPGQALDFALLATTPEAKLFRSPKLRAALRPAFATDFERTSLRLAFADGSSAELCLDSGTIRAGRRAAAISEIELELIAGSPARLFEFARQLVERVPLRLGGASKAERGYALAQVGSARPIKAARLDLGHHVSVAAAFAAIVRSCMAHLQANEAGFLAGKDPEYLHQMRVAVRRLRACFSLFRAVLPPATFVSLLAELKTQASALGAARDWDVFLDETLRALRARCEDETVLTAFARRCARMRRAQQRAAQRVVVSADWQRLWLELGRLLADGAWADGQSALALPVGDFAAALLQQRAEILNKRGRHLRELDAAGRHRLRIAAKKLRYAAEFFEALYHKKQLKLYVESLARMQQLLGGLNDAANLLRLLPEVYAGARLRDPRVEGMIQGWSAASTHLQLDALRSAWDHWQRQKPFWKSPQVDSKGGAHV